MGGYTRLRREHGYEPTEDNTPRYPNENTLIIHRHIEVGDSYAYLGQMNDYAKRRRIYVLYCEIGTEITEDVTLDRRKADEIYDRYAAELNRL